MAEIFPFGIIGNDILLPINSLDNLCCINSIPNFEDQDRQISKRLLTEDVTKKKRTNPKDVGRKKKENTAFFVMDKLVIYEKTRNLKSGRQSQNSNSSFDSDVIIQNQNG